MVVNKEINKWDSSIIMSSFALIALILILPAPKGELQIGDAKKYEIIEMDDYSFWEESEFGG